MVGGGAPLRCFDLTYLPNMTVVRVKELVGSFRPSNSLVELEQRRGIAGVIWQRYVSSGEVVNGVITISPAVRFQLHGVWGCQDVREVSGGPDNLAGPEKDEFGSVGPALGSQWLFASLVDLIAAAVIHVFLLREAIKAGGAQQDGQLTG